MRKATAYKVISHPTQRLTLRPTLFPTVASRSARDARPKAGHNSQLRWRWRVARSHAGQELLTAPPPTLTFSLLGTSPIGGLGGCRTARKGAVTIGVADLFWGGENVGTETLYIRYKKGKNKKWLNHAVFGIFDVHFLTLQLSKVETSCF